MNSTNTRSMQFAAPPRPEMVEEPFIEDEPMPIELTEEIETGRSASQRRADQPVYVWGPGPDWYLDHTEQTWLTVRAVEQHYPRSRSRFENGVARDAFGLRQSRRRTWTTHETDTRRRYGVYEYPLHRLLAWRGLAEAEADPAAADHTETVWLTPTGVQERFGCDRTTFQHAVSADRAGLRWARRRGSVPGPAAGGGYYYQYPQWRVDEWAGVSDLTVATLPSPAQIKQLRTKLDVTASLLAREVGFSAAEVRTAAQTGDLDARLDGNTGRMLFSSPEANGQWLRRESWRRGAR